MLWNVHTFQNESISTAVFIDDKTLKDIVTGIWFYVGKEVMKNPNMELLKYEWSEEDEKILNSLIRLYGGEYSAKAWPWSDGVITYGDVVNFLKSLRPQPKQEWNEDWREEDIQTRFAFYTYKNEEDDGVLYLSNVFVEEASRNHGFGTRILRAAEKVAETIGATTICLKVKQDSPANAWYRKNGYGYVAFEDGYDWLEKNLEYMKPNKQDWSEEDERKYQCIRSILLTDMDKKIGSWKYSEILEWYEKRGTGRYTNSQPHWKPSEDEERLINTSISFLKDFADKGYENAVECIDWLKSKLNGNSC